MTGFPVAERGVRLQAHGAHGGVRLLVQGATARLVVDNTARRNAMSRAMMTQMRRHLLDLAERDDVLVVVVVGAGGTFIAGADIGQLGSEQVDGQRSVDEEFVLLLEAIAATPQPVVAAITGACRGAGVGIAAAADLRIADTGATFGIPAARLGLGYPSSAVRRLAYVVGMAQATWMLLTGEACTAQEAARIGLVHRISDDVEASVDDVVSTLVANAPLAIRAAKAALRATASAPTDPALEALAEEAVGAAQASSDLKEGAAAFLERRRADFRGK